MSFTTRPVSGSKPARKKFPWQKCTLFVLQFGYPLIAWFRRHRQEKAIEKQHEHRVSILKRILVILVSVLLALFLLAGVAKALFHYKIITLSSVINTVASDLPTDEHGYTNFLLLGQGDASHEGVDLTDTLMIASIDATKTKSVAMISIPRDLYFTKTDKMGVGRVNSLYRDYKGYLRKQGMSESEASQESMKELAREIGKTFGVQIHGVIRVDFIGFVQVVDALGGVDVDVPSPLVDTLYPGPDYSYVTFAIDAGPHHLDGETALKYARSRHSTSDFSRSARQQQIITALAQRAKEKGILSSPSTILSLWNTVSQHAESTLGLRELVGVAKLGTEIDRHNVVSVQINDISGQADGPSEAGGFLYIPPKEDFSGAFVLLPLPHAGFGTWEPLRIFTQFFLTSRDLLLQHPPIDVLNAGAQSGLARTLAGDLLRFDFDLNKIENSKLPDQDHSIIIARTGTGETLAPALSTMLHIPIAPAPPELDQSGLGMITILLGKDYQYKSLPALLREESTLSASSASPKNN